MKYNCVHKILLEHSLSMCLHGTHTTAASLDNTMLPLGCIDCSIEALLRTSDHHADCCHFTSISHLQECPRLTVKVTLQKHRHACCARA